MNDGSLQLCVIGRDSIGNWQAEACGHDSDLDQGCLPPAGDAFRSADWNEALSTVLDITVAGTDVGEYKYKIREAADAACSNSTGYSATTAVATHITDSIAALADGALQVCVIGKDASGNWQLEGTVQSHPGPKTPRLPSPAFRMLPAEQIYDALDVTIAGTDVTEYKYKLRESATTACSNSTGYSSAIAVATKITDSLSGLSEGATELCVIGRDAAGNWQTEASATAVSWTKDTSAPTATISGEPTGTNSTAVLNITVAGADVSHYKFKIREIGRSRLFECYRI